MWRESAASPATGGIGRGVRTGDLVIRTVAPCPCGRPWARLDGGVLGRVDDMVNIRGVNVYPGSIEAVVRRFADKEIFVEVQENVRGEDVFVIQSTSAPANDHLMELLILIDALRRASAGRITANLKLWVQQIPLLFTPIMPARAVLV